MAPTLTIKRLIAAALTAALILGAPGPGPFEALAALRTAPVTTGGANVKIGAPSMGASLGSVSNPLSAPSLTGSASLTDLSLPLPSGAAPSAAKAAPAVGSGPVAKLIAGPSAARAAFSAPAASPGGASRAVAPAALKRAVRPKAAQGEAAAPVSAKAHQAAFAEAVKKTGREVPAARGNSILKKLFSGARLSKSSSDSSVAAPESSPMRTNLKRGALLTAAAVTAAAVPTPAFGAVQEALPWLGFLEGVSWSPAAVLLTALAAPFILYLVPALIKAARRGRARQIDRLARSVVGSPDKKGKLKGEKVYVRELIRDTKDGARHVDRVIVMVPDDSSIGRRGYRFRGGITMMSRTVSKPIGRWRVVETAKYEFSPDGKARSGEKSRHRVPKGGAWKDAKELDSDVFFGENSLARTLLSRWAPHESGKFKSLAVGLIPGLIAFGLAALTSHPLTAFLWTGIGMAGGMLSQWWNSRGVRDTRGRERFMARAFLIAGIPSLAATFLLGIPAGLGIMAGFTAAAFGTRGFFTAHLNAPEAPAPKRARRAGSGFAKAKFALIGLLIFAAASSVFFPNPIDANDRVELASRMETGAVGSEYAEYVRDHPEVPVYYPQAWQFEDMSGVIGRHYDRTKTIRPARIYVNPNSYGVDGTSWKAFELSLSTLLHEFDHDKQERDLDGVPTSLQHEYSAWDHQARFIIEQFKKNPDLFKPGQNDRRKRLMLERAQRWLEKGPQAYRDYVKSQYSKNKDISTFKSSRAEAWQKYYEAHKAEMEAAWNAQKDNAALKTDIKDAIAALKAGGNSSKKPPTMRPKARTILNAFLFGFWGILSLLGLQRLLSLRLRRR